MQRRPTGRGGWLVQFTLKVTLWYRRIGGLKPLHQGLKLLPKGLGQTVGKPVIGGGDEGRLFTPHITVN